MKMGKALKSRVFKSPFVLNEVIADREFRPDLNQEYLVQYKFPKDKESIFVIGRFHKVWFGYNFHWFWGSASLQLSIDSNDIHNFVGIWEVTRLPEPANLVRVKKEDFVTEEEMNI